MLLERSQRGCRTLVPEQDLHPLREPDTGAGRPAIHKNAFCSEQFVNETMRRIRKELSQEGIEALSGVIGTDDKFFGHGFEGR